MNIFSNRMESPMTSSYNSNYGNNNQGGTKKDDRMSKLEDAPFIDGIKLY